MVAQKCSCAYGQTSLNLSVVSTVSKYKSKVLSKKRWLLNKTCASGFTILKQQQMSNDEQLRFCKSFCLATNRNKCQQRNNLNFCVLSKKRWHLFVQVMQLMTSHFLKLPITVTLQKMQKFFMSNCGLSSQIEKFLHAVSR